MLATLKSLIARARQLVAEARKAAAGVVGVVAEIVATGVLHGTAAHVAAIVIAAATAVGVYQLPNKASSKTVAAAK